MFAGVLLWAKKSKYSTQDSHLFSVSPRANDLNIFILQINHRIILELGFELTKCEPKCHDFCHPLCCFYQVPLYSSYEILWSGLGKRSSMLKNLGNIGAASTWLQEFLWAFRMLMQLMNPKRGRMPFCKFTGPSSPAPGPRTVLASHWANILWNTVHKMFLPNSVEGCCFLLPKEQNEKDSLQSLLHPH